jgi:hypothetical protein
MTQRDELATAPKLYSCTAHAGGDNGFGGAASSDTQQMCAGGYIMHATGKHTEQVRDTHALSAVCQLAAQALDFEHAHGTVSSQAWQCCRSTSGNALCKCISIVVQALLCTCHPQLRASSLPSSRLLCCGSTAYILQSITALSSVTWQG